MARDANDVDDLLTKTTGVVVDHDVNVSYRIRFLLPNGYMHQLKIVTYQQQNEINIAINKYTDGNQSYIDWSMVGVDDALDIIDRYENYCNTNTTMFNKMIVEEHIMDVELCRNEIIYNLNGKKS